MSGLRYRVVFSPEARDQLAALEDAIAAAGAPHTAAEYVDAIVSFCEQLARFPARGVPRDDLLDGLRVTHYGAARWSHTGSPATKSRCLACTTVARIMRLSFGQASTTEAPAGRQFDGGTPPATRARRAFPPATYFRFSPRPSHPSVVPAGARTRQAAWIDR